METFLVLQYKWLASGAIPQLTPAVLDAGTPLIEMEKKNQLYAFKLTDGVYKRTQVTQEGIGSLKFGELSDVDIWHAVEKRVHTLVSADRKWTPFADPVPEGWLIDIRISSPYVVTGQRHKIRKILNSGTRLCS